MYNALDKTKMILSEHMTSYLILAVSPDAPNTLQIRTDNRYAAAGMAEHALEILKDNLVDTGWEIVWDVDDEDEEDF